jgi:hypothetical protein
MQTIHAILKKIHELMTTERTPEGGLLDDKGIWHALPRGVLFLPIIAGKLAFYRSPGLEEWIGGG